MSKTIIQRAPLTGNPTFEQVTRSAKSAGLWTAREVAGSYEVPSASRPGVVYTVSMWRPGQATCSCEHRGPGCWHAARALELAAAAKAGRTDAEVRERFHAALAELFGAVG